jgi:hypothetical protein
MNSDHFDGESPGVPRLLRPTFAGLDISAGTTICLFCEPVATDAGQEFDIAASGRSPHFGFGGGVRCGNAGPVRLPVAFTPASEVS